MLASSAPLALVLAPVLAVAEGAPGFQINLFWVATQAATFLIFLAILYFVAFRRIGGVLEERRSRIEQGLRDADAARQERERAASERLATLATARAEANELIARAQRVGDENRERQLAETRAEIERLRERANSDIQAELERALGEVRAQVAELALLAAGRVVGASMDRPLQRRLVDEFLQDQAVGTGGSDGKDN
ncbi:MAG: F0F1 ATP synthase subunit B [Chloroflexota bacterium]|nr:F0F1 ATP synthase subunit B [Chloroflexota bacterium]